MYTEPIIYTASFISLLNMSFNNTAVEHARKIVTEGKAKGYFVPNRVPLAFASLFSLSKLDKRLFHESRVIPCIVPKGLPSPLETIVLTIADAENGFGQSLKDIMDLLSIHNNNMHPWSNTMLNTLSGDTYQVMLTDLNQELRKFKHEMDIGLPLKKLKLKEVDAQVETEVAVDYEVQLQPFAELKASKKNFFKDPENWMAGKDKKALKPAGVFKIIATLEFRPKHLDKYLDQTTDMNHTPDLDAILQSVTAICEVSYIIPLYDIKEISVNNMDFGSKFRVIGDFPMSCGTLDSKADIVKEATALAKRMKGTILSGKLVKKTKQLKAKAATKAKLEAYKAEKLAEAADN